MIHTLDFQPFPLLQSPRVQTIVGSYAWHGTPPPTHSHIFPLNDGDLLSCEESIPVGWKPTQKTIILIHGLTGSHQSNYMIRLSRKFYMQGYKVIRLNMRGCGTGKYLAKKPYHAGRSEDILQVIKSVKANNPASPIFLLGFSLGGNIVLKLAGELGKGANDLLAKTIAICPPIDLEACLSMMQHVKNQLFHRYYLGRLHAFAKPWIGDKKYASMEEFDNCATAPLTGFASAHDYYKKCSSRYVLPSIAHPCHILFSKDDPIIDYSSTLTMKLDPLLHIGLSEQGGHMGFLGKTNFFWMDEILMKWILSP